MGRPSRFDDEQLLDAVDRLVAADGPSAVSTRRVAGSIGAATGSLYHRFASRDLLIARAWLRAVGDFQAGYLAALSDDDVDAAAIGAAGHVPAWADTHPAQAALLLRHRRDDLVARWPDELVDELAHADHRVERALRNHARRRYGSAAAQHRLVVRFALVHLPEAAVRATTEPGRLIDAVGAAALAVLRLRRVAA